MVFAICALVLENFFDLPGVKVKGEPQIKHKIEADFSSAKSWGQESFRGRGDDAFKRFLAFGVNETL